MSLFDQIPQNQKYQKLTYEKVREVMEDVFKNMPPPPATIMNYVWGTNGMAIHRIFTDKITHEASKDIEIWTFKPKKLNVLYLSFFEKHGKWKAVYDLTKNLPYRLYEGTRYVTDFKSLASLKKIIDATDKR